MNSTLSRVCASLLALALISACQPSGQAAPSANTPSSQATAAADAIAVSDAWAAATPNGATVGGGYLTIANNGDASDALKSATSPRSPRVELHEMSMQGNMMQMRPVARLEIPAHGSVALAPGGYHLMFNDITAPFVAGQDVPVTLTFEHHAPITVTLPVRDRSATAPAMNMPGMEHDQH